MIQNKYHILIVPEDETIPVSLGIKYIDLNNEIKTEFLCKIEATEHYDSFTRGREIVMSLNKDIKKLNVNLLTTGYDLDTENPQFCHICYPYDMQKGAICNTDKLWFYGNSFMDNKNDVSCKECLELLPSITND